MRASLPAGLLQGSFISRFATDRVPFWWLQALSFGPIWRGELDLSRAWDHEFQ